MPNKEKFKFFPKREMWAPCVDPLYESGCPKYSHSCIRKKDMSSSSVYILLVNIAICFFIVCLSITVYMDVSVIHEFISSEKLKMIPTD